MLGSPAAGNVPGARVDAVNWTDNSGNLWLFGGEATTVSGSLDYFTDLWEFNVSTGEWAWMGGSASGYHVGVYGTLGVAAPGNQPGTRASAAGWTDGYGNLWLFGGGGLDSQRMVELNDLWEYNPSTNEWTWVSGASSSPGVNSGVYGTQGTPAEGNVPGGRLQASTWTDSSGNLWLFGGDGRDSSGMLGRLNDLWKFTPSTSDWAWMSGSKTADCQDSGVQPCAPPSPSYGKGIFGTLGTPDAANTPGERSGASSWIDGNGNLWLFSGFGLDANGKEGFLNDLWEFNPSTSEWTWMGGSNTISCGSYPCGEPGVYGTLGTPAAGNIPGGINTPATWTDANGNFWLFGGGGDDANGNRGNLNALWMFSPSTNEWTWMGGSSTVPYPTAPVSGEPGVYGELGVPAAANQPGGRAGALGWVDGSGNFWLLGGVGYDAGATRGYLNDLWQYQPPGVSPLASRPTFSVLSGTYFSTQTVSLADTTPGATIYYSLDGSTPSSDSNEYAAPLSIAQTTTVKAIAIASGFANSPVSSATYTISPLPAATPVFAPGAGVYATPQTVSITDSTEGATIYYTTDGTTPSANSRLYAGTVTVSANETIQAIAIANGYSSSTVATAVYIINLQAATPFFSVPAGTYTSVQTVVISDTTAGAQIHFTTNGTTPTAASTQYLGPVTVSTTEAIEAIAVLSGYSNSAVAAATYTINLPPAATPVITPAGGAYTAPQTVTISDVTQGAMIYYTADGTMPSVNSRLYAGAMTVSANETIEAIAIANGYSNSAVAAAAYTIAKATPQITWPAPAAITYGTALSTNQLNATASTGGTFSYAPASGAALGAGPHTLTVTFTPTDTTDYTTATATTTLTVNQAILTVTANNASRAYAAPNPTFTAVLTGFVNGDPQSVVSGSPLLTTPATAASPVSAYPITAAQGSLAATNYSFTFVNGTLTVNQASGVIHWPAPAAINYGAALSGAQLDATATCSGASVNGTYVYSPASGAVLASGAQTLSVNFKPTSSNCTFTSATVPLTVNQVALTVTANIASRAYGTPNPAFTSSISGFVNGDTAARAVSGSASFTTTATAKSPVSTYPITPAAGTLAAANYTFKFAAGRLTVTKAALTVTATGASVLYNQPIPKLTYSLAGYLNGDTSSVITGTPSETTTATKGSALGTYPITITQGTLAATNYSFKFVSGTLTITALGTTATPVFHPTPGTSNAAVTVTLTDSTSGAVYYYTANGTTPTTSSPMFPSSGLKVSATETITAIAVAPGYTPSAPVSATYTIATAPAVTTLPASGMTTTAATLNGTVTADNATTQYWFAYGTSKTALSSTTAKTGSLTGTTATAVSAKLTGLKTKTNYYFQVVASNAVGTTPGTVLSFTTN